MARAIRHPVGRSTLAAVLAALALGVPTAAYPISLANLLRMPLEQLLRLEITSSAALPGVPRGG